jgi:hypothetical protein
MGKRGQLTLFIVLGMILLVLVGIMVYYRASITETVNKNILHRNVAVPREVNDIQDYVRGCVDDMSVVMLYQLGAQGGLLSPSGEKGVITDQFSVAYGYYTGKNVLPSTVDFKREFSSFMNLYLPNCLSLGDFGKFHVTPSKPSTSLEFLDDKVKVSVDYPLTVSEGESVFNVDEPYTVEYPLRIKFLHDIANGIVTRTASDPKNIDVSYLLGLGIKVDVYPYDTKTIVYSLSDSKSVFRNSTYEYRFAVRYAK